ncbi:MAG: nitrogenase [Candidatus Methanoperedenaceae archaeon]|nr:MAG: nitrogenase [Candidatus Methanoperedenaceae archaeon]
MVNNIVKTVVNNETPVVNLLESPRHSCTFGGAYTATNAVKGLVPILHTGPGCGWTNFFGLVAGSGGGFLGDLGAMQTPSSSLLEKHIVFGGEDKLRDLLNSTNELMNGELFVVIPGCIPTMIGDDIGMVVNEFRAKNNTPIIHVKTSGFNGNSYKGYELFLDAVIDQLLEEPVKVKKGLVNIIGIAPCQHIFWKGDLKELQRTLELIGLEVNPIFGDLKGIESLKKIPEAELNIVVNPWLGKEVADKLETKFGTPFIVQYGLPVGPRETEHFVQDVGKKLGIPREKIDQAIQKEIKEAYQFYNYISNGLYMGLANSYFGVAAESNIAIGLTRFLTNDCGMMPTVVIITDDPPLKNRESIKQRLTEDINSINKPDVIFEIDTYNIEKILQNYPNLIVLGSSMEKYFSADKLSALHLTVSFPAYDRMLLRRTYSGFFGGINLLEDLMGKMSRPF